MKLKSKENPLAFVGTRIWTFTSMTSFTSLETVQLPAALGKPAGTSPPFPAPVPSPRPGAGPCIPSFTPLKFGPLSESVAVAEPELRAPSEYPSRGTRTVPKVERMPCCASKFIAPAAVWE